MPGCQPLPLVPRFMKFVMPEPNSGCWLWMGAINKQTGYGAFGKRRKVYSAHRISYEIHKGEIPAGLEIDHLCRVRCCVNPDHLEAVTSRENTLRGSITYDHHMGKRTHCFRGHFIDGVDPGRINKNGKQGRFCRICRADRQKERRARKKEL